MTDTHISERYEFRNIKQNEAEEAAEIERICFPPNEACSKKHMKDRVAGIADLFLVVILSLIHISEPTRRTPISYAVFCLKKKKKKKKKKKIKKKTRQTVKHT